LIVTFPAGSAPDIIGRLAGQRLSERLSQQFVIENKPGFGGNIATEYVVNSPADGYTILMPVSTNAVNATLYPNLSFNFLRDIAPIANIAKTPFVVVVPALFPVETLLEFIAHAKANPGKINMASGGVGSSPHVCGELLQIMSGIKLVHVPYRSNYMPDLLSGGVQVVFNPIAQALPLIREGKIINKLSDSRIGYRPSRAMTGCEQVQQKASLLDQLVGAQEKRFGDCQAEGLGGGQINDEVEFGRLLDRYVAWVGTAQNLVDIIGGAPVQVREVCSIGHQTCRFDVLPIPMHRWQSRAQRQGVDSNPIGVHEPVRTNVKCFRTALDRLESVRDIFGSQNFECIEFEIERAGRRLSLAQLQHGEGIIDIGQDRHSAQTWNNLAQDFDPLAGKLVRLDGHASDIAAGPGQAGDNAVGHGVPHPRKNNRDG
jgi:hypothetical protein